jgi:hypothetical protein
MRDGLIVGGNDEVGFERSREGALRRPRRVERRNREAKGVRSARSARAGPSQRDGRTILQRPNILAERPLSLLETVSLPDDPLHAGALL